MFKRRRAKWSGRRRLKCDTRRNESWPKLQAQKAECHTDTQFDLSPAAIVAVDTACATDVEECSDQPGSSMTVHHSHHDHWSPRGVEDNDRYSQLRTCFRPSCDCSAERDSLGFYLCSDKAKKEDTVCLRRLVVQSDDVPYPLRNSSAHADMQLLHMSTRYNVHSPACTTRALAFYAIACYLLPSCCASAEGTGERGQ